MGKSSICLLGLSVSQNQADRPPTALGRQALTDMLLGSSGFGSRGKS